VTKLTDLLRGPGRTQVAGAPDGFYGPILAELAGTGRDVLFVASEGMRASAVAEALAYFAPGLEVLEFPGWDCLPYDRVSPDAGIVSRRIDVLTRLLVPKTDGKGRVILSTVSALLQRVPPRATFTGSILEIRAGGPTGPKAVIDYLEGHGYTRSDIVMEPGEYAVRGGILDVFPSGRDEPLRLDFFGDELESIRSFDAASQRTTSKLDRAAFKPTSEVPLDEASISRFRGGYRELFGATGDDDPLYEAVSAGRRHIGMEHWLPLFYERLETIGDYLPSAVVVFDRQAGEAEDARLELIKEYYVARADLDKRGNPHGSPYRPIPPERLYLAAGDLEALLQGRNVITLSPYAPAEASAADAGATAARDFADVRVNPERNLFDELRDHIAALQIGGHRVILAATSGGSLSRLETILHEHGITQTARADDWVNAKMLGPKAVGLSVVALEHGFTTADVAVISEEDILGDRLVRSARRKARPENVITEAAAISEGDLVVHADHGIGRYEGLETLQVAGAAHDCLKLTYDGGDKLFVPVENIEVLSRYGSDDMTASLDKLGGAAWQARKARLKERIREMADQLIRIAAARMLRPAPVLEAPPGSFDEFCARFPYAETEDQNRAILETLDDLTGGKPMDRLICGDVGFGKTEVALRAAFVAVMTGKQVAVVVPTTLLARQHYQTFAQRFAPYPVRVQQLSRLVAPKHAKLVKEELAAGKIDIIVGTHALLAKSVSFKDLGLLVVDEEQHFGVAHKERLKEIKADVHVLTLTATPIPRTLQLAMTGVKGLSMIATPPVDRIAVRTFILPYDPVVVREAILREHFRGGQSFYVCPRIQDLDLIRERLAELVPEVKTRSAHGQMPAKDLEEVMTAFYDGKFDVLLSTNIVESGLDLPSVNTIVIHRADLFGLAQLYQLRGRVGRSKVRAYAYLTLPVRQKISALAERRLEVMHGLDSLGAGFSLASHDLDIRGAGNLLGEEQSGHIKEVGIELYHQMLEEAVASARGLDAEPSQAAHWSPQIGIGVPVLIPESYVSDLDLRLSLYRRIAGLAENAEIEAFAAEMIDRFGPLPEEVENLLQSIALKNLCRAAGIDKIDAGPKGAVVSFHDNKFSNPAGLVEFITKQVGTAKLRPDHKLVYQRAWDEPKERLKGVRNLAQNLADIAKAA
jgi:transcription-repair coupling factor (superfamily II helicase)